MKSVPNVLSLGKWRRLQQAASPKGVFSVLAVDHRGPLRRALESCVTAVDETLAAVKQDIVRELAPMSSAVLLDPETGVAPCVTSGALPGATALLVALDTGSTGDPAVLKTSLVENWNAEQSAQIGAAGVKLLVYYHPETPEADDVERLVARIGEDCARCQLPFYLEPLSFTPGNPTVRLPSASLRKVVIETARRLVPLGVDVLKVEFPVRAEDESLWQEACQELSAECPVPWVLLSAGVPFDTFLRQALAACQAGASGVMVGRAVWKEAITSDAAARRQFLKSAGIDRMRRLHEVCDTHGRSFGNLHQPPASAAPMGVIRSG